MKIRNWLTILSFLLLASCSSAQSKPLVIEGAWARPALAGQTSAVYFTIDNPNRAADQLLAASTDVAGQTELHQTIQDNQGVMSMHAQHSFEIPGEDQLVFAPGGRHIMLVDLKQDLKPGDLLDLHLTFEKAGEMTIQATVQEEP
jgi:periplasmic copper chaperone A